MVLHPGMSETLIGPRNGFLNGNGVRLRASREEFQQGKRIRYLLALYCLQSDLPCWEIFPSELIESSPVNDRVFFVHQAVHRDSFRAAIPW